MHGRAVKLLARARQIRQIRNIAHVTDIPVDGSKGGICFMKSDGKTLYYPPNPAADLTPATEDIAIPLTASGSSTPTKATIPNLHQAGSAFPLTNCLNFS